MGQHIYEVRNEDKREMALASTTRGLIEFKTGFTQALPESFQHWDIRQDSVVFSLVEADLAPSDAEAFLREYPKHSLPLGWRFLQILR
jgi:hypothetical protein